MELLLIGHILGDFYFQTDNISDRKQESNGSLIVHSLIYAGTLYVIATLFLCSITKYILAAFIIAASHYIIDFIKIKVEKKTDCDNFIIFVADQLIHILVLVVVIHIWPIYVTPDGLQWFITIYENTELLAVIIAVLLCGKPASIIVSLAFEKLNGENLKTTDNKKSDEIKAGKWIGVLEREIILLLGLIGEYSAIGFVLAAKSLARHKQFNKEGFAEKYLVGTLLSSLIAFVCVFLCQK